MKAVAYIRVSGKGQVDGDGPDRQRDAIARFCVVNGLQFMCDFFEQGVSGTVDGFDRPEFSAALNWASQDRGPDLTAIVVERMDRLARDLMVQELILRECRERNVRVYATDQGLVDMASDGVDPSRILIRQIMGAIAQWEKSVIVMKLRKARDRKRAETGRCEGPKPYGAEPGEQTIVDAILNRRKFGYTVHDTAWYLNNNNTTRRNGKPWTAAAVRHVLTNQGKYERRKI